MPCPKCKSNNIATNNKGYGIGKGVIGASLIGPLGLVAGNIGKNDIICTCLDCGHQWRLKDQIRDQQWQAFVNNMQKEQEEKEIQKNLDKQKAEMLGHTNNNSKGMLESNDGGIYFLSGLLFLLSIFCFICKGYFSTILSLLIAILICPTTSELIYKKILKYKNIDKNSYSMVKIVSAVILFCILISRTQYIENGENQTKQNLQSAVTQIKTSTQSSKQSATVPTQTTKPIQQQTKQPFTGVLTMTQIDKICKTSLSEVNANPVSNYVKVSSNSSAKKYTYQSKETTYKYTCAFTGKDTFYVNGVGWEDMIPRGTLYKGKTSNCIEFDLYDPGFRLTHNFTICD